MYFLGSTSPKLASTIDCSHGANDTLSGGSGIVDYIVGGAYSDSLHGDEGMDLVFGDHAEIHFFAAASH